MKRLLLAAAAFGSFASAPAALANHHEKADAMAQVLSDERRDDDRARDQYRHPAETLDFFGVKPGMTIVDYMPSSGWYTRVLVPYIGTTGRYIGINPDGSTANDATFTDYAAKLSPRFRSEMAGWRLAGAPVEVYDSNELDAAANGTVDRVLIFREMHNLHRRGIVHQELTRLRALLKDDGLLGVVQHRAKPWASGDYTNGSKGYLRQSDVIGLIEAHGFELVATSEVNANPRDPANHSRGVWELPPVSGNDDPALREIGESDRMTLLFKKRL